MRWNDVPIGRVSPAYTGYKTHKALLTVDVRLETRHEARQSVTHEPLSVYTVFGISLGVWNTQRSDIIIGGQAREALDNIVSYAPGWDARKVARLKEFWGHWHLNYMQADCACIWRWGACPIGYRSGTSWLVQPLPYAVHDAIVGLFEEAEEG